METLFFLRFHFYKRLTIHSAKETEFWSVRLQLEFAPTPLLPDSYFLQFLFLFFAGHGIGLKCPWGC